MADWSGLAMAVLGGGAGVGLIMEWRRRQKARREAAKPRPKIPFGRTVLDEFSDASGQKTKFDDVGGCYFYIHFDSQTLHALIVDGETPYILKVKKHDLMWAGIHATRGRVSYNDQEVFLDAVLKALAIEPKEPKK